MKKIYSSIMAVALFASALSCTSGGNTNDAGTQTAQTQALDSDGTPTGGEWITMFDGKTLKVGWLKTDRSPIKVATIRQTRASAT